MGKFYITLIICLMMIPLIPFSSHFAVGASSPFYTHFIYMFGHASFIHWLCNAWSLLVLHNVINYHRVIAAWIFSVLASFVLILWQACTGSFCIRIILYGHDHIKHVET
jgi:membrane associated rhomboid family serine protease